MEWKFEEEFRLDKPETIGERDKHFDLDNYKDWLEFQLSEARKQLSLFTVRSSVCEHLHQKWEGEYPHNSKRVCQVCREVLAN